MSGGPPALISIAESQCFQALGDFLQAICSPSPLTVVRGLGSTSPGSNVRVPEPIAGDFIVMSALRSDRLETNETTFTDNIVVGSMSATTLTVTEVIRGSLAPGLLVIDYGYPGGNIRPNTTIVAQLTGTIGGVGDYHMSVSQTLASETLYAGTRTDIAATEWCVQLDVHGPNSGNNVRVIETLFRSEYGVDFFTNSGFWIAPLFINTAGQIPWVNAEGEVEFRWVQEAHLAVTPIVTTPQQFAQQIRVTNREAGVIAATGATAVAGTLPTP